MNSTLTHSLSLGMSNMTLNELLDSLGFDAWKTLTASFVLFSFNLMGVVFSSVSFWIFTRRQFRRETVFFYYRLLSLVFLLHSLHSLPLAICYSPRYFKEITQLNTRHSSIYLIVNNLVSNFQVKTLWECQLDYIRARIEVM